jgi:DNA-binding response OmpR family regulator
LADVILIADDEADIVSTTKMILEAEGYRVVTASTGEMALEKADSEMPDLILLDVVMPGKNGIEICKILKGNAKTKHIPVLIFTASGRDVEDLVAQAGADGYFPKLFNPEDLLAEVKKRLDQVKASKS